VTTIAPDRDYGIGQPVLQLRVRRDRSAAGQERWSCAQQVRLRDAGRLGRLVRWRVPGLAPELSFGEMFRSEPFVVLREEPGTYLVSGLVGRIWTLRRDYPRLTDPEEFMEWSRRGTARVLFANWVSSADGGAVLTSEARVDAFGVQGRLGVRAVRPLVRAFGPLVGSEGIAAAVRLAEGAR